jgi:hypothetical protein
MICSFVKIFVMDNNPVTIKNDVPETSKKKWSKPVFEIISLDVVKGGHGSSAELNTAHS